MPQSHGVLDRSTIRLVAALAAGVLLLAAVVGNASATLAAERTGAAVPVDAVVLENTPASAPARVAWSEPDGPTGVATVAVPTGVRAGETRRIWVAPDGAVVPRPDTGAGPWVAALLTVLLGSAAGATAVAAYRAGLRRARDRDLTQEWERVEPQWTGRAA